MNLNKTDSAIQPVILAAGRGTRMGGDLPKVLQRIGGKPMVEHVLSCCENLRKRLSVSIPILVTGFKADCIRSQVKIPFKEVFQKIQNGTGHAVSLALEEVDPNFLVLVLYGDVPLVRPETLESIIKSASSTDLSILTVFLDNPTGYGRILKNSAGDVTGIVEEADATLDQKALKECNTGILIGRADLIKNWLSKITHNNAQGELYLTDIVGVAAHSGASIGSVSVQMSEVAGANDFEQLATLERAYQFAQAEKLMKKGVILKDPARIDIRGTLQTGKSVIIDVNVVFEGDVIIGDNVTIEPNCVISNSSIQEGSVIRAFSHIDGSNIGCSVEVGPYARIRKDTHLQDGSKVGNFVETKNVRLGAGSKANHLTYLGDADIGSNSNVGAGTITCNYDGANKHRTKIGETAFIGSNTSLVAPVTVEDGATIAAGSTITKNVGADSLGIARAKQANISKWNRPVKS